MVVVNEVFFLLTGYCPVVLRIASRLDPAANPVRSPTGTPTP